MSRRWLIAVSVVAHLAIAVGLFVSGVWRLERLDAEHRPLHGLAVMLPPQAQAGGSSAAPPPKIPPKVRIHPKVLTQPPAKRTETAEIPSALLNQTNTPPSADPPETPTGECLADCAPSVHVDPVCGNRAVEAGEQCDDGNLVNGDGCSSTCQLEPRPRPRPTTVVPSELQGLRIFGDTQLHPDSATVDRMVREGTSSVRGVVKLCIATDGRVASATMLAPTKYPAYDATLVSGVQAWRYRPYLLDGVAVPACSTVTFIYTIR